jgi:hypothetical protein
MPAQIFTEGQDPLDAQGINPAGRMPTGTPSPDAFSYPTGPQIMGAAFRQNNPVVSVLDALSRSQPDMTPVPDYNPVTKLSGTKDDDLIEQSLADVNPAQTDARIAQKNDEIKDQQTLSAAGWSGTVASIAAGATDPSWFIPILGELKGAEVATVTARALRGMGEGLVKSTVSEAALQSSQVTRTPQASVENIATNTLLMGLIGGGLGMLAPAERVAARDGLDATRKDLSPTPSTVGIDTVKATGEAPLQPELPLHDQASIIPDGIPEPKTLATDLSAASSDKRTMQLSRIMLPDNMMTALKAVPIVGNAIDYTEKVLMGFSPTLRVFSSDSLVAKRAMGDLAETSLRFTQADSGITSARGGIPIDRLVKMQAHDGQLTGSQILRDQFIVYRGLEDAKLPMQNAALQDMRGVAPGKISFDDFKTQVSGAMTNGDVHAVPQVQQAAQLIRQQVLDPVTRLAQRTMGPDGKPMLADALEPPKGDKSFFPRIWNKQAIAAGYNDVKKTFTDWLESEQGIKAAAKDRITGHSERLDASEKRIANLEQKIEQYPVNNKARADHEYELRLESDKRDGIRAALEKEINDWHGDSVTAAKAALRARAKAEVGRDLDKPKLRAADPEVDAAVRTIMKSPRDLSRQELESRAAEIVNRINTAPDGRLPYDIANGGPQMGPPGERQQVRGSLNSRDFAIPTSLVKDFVNTDTEHVISSHLRTVLPDIHLTDRFGDVEMTDVFKKINDEYDAKLATAKSAKQQIALDNEKKAMVRDLAATRDRVRNVYGWEQARTQPNAARIANVARNYNLITDLGTSVFNRLTDATNAVWRHGLMNVFGDGYIPFFKSMVGMGDGFATTARQSMKDMGVGIDSAIGHLANQWGDVIDNNMPGSKFERALAWSAQKSMMVNLHGPWTDGMKTISGTVAAAEFLRTAEKIAGGTHSTSDIQRMAQAGIEPAMATRIWEAYKDGGGKEFGDGTHVANTADWTDTQARDVFSSAIARSADMAVLTPGMEKPLWMSSPVVSLMGQYKSFVAAAHEKVLISNLQQMDGRTLQGLVAALGMGMISYRAYTLWSGTPVSDRPQDWIKEAISRSALMGWFSEINSMQAKFSGGATDVFRAIGADHPLSRRQSNSALSEVLGPTYSRLEGIAGGVNDAFHGTWTAMDTHKFRQAIFLQNLFAVRRLLDSAEDGFNERIGVKSLNRDPSLWPGATKH